MSVNNHKEIKDRLIRAIENLEWKVINNLHDAPKDLEDIDDCLDSCLESVEEIFKAYGYLNQLREKLRYRIYEMR